MTLDRRRCLAALGALGFLPASPAGAQGPSPFLGLWSGAIVDEGRMTRFRLTVSADGKATLVLIDAGEIAIDASKVELEPTTLRLSWPEFQLTFTGRLTAPDAIDAVLTQGGVDSAMSLTRGDRFPRKAPPPPAVAPMTAALLQDLRLFAETPALGVGWASPTQRRRVLADGLRSADAGARVTAADKWQIGSCTKSMVGVMIARLVEAGRLDWTLAVGQALGRQAPDMHPAFRDATLLHLLSHRAGMARDPALADLNTFGFGPVADPRPERLRFARLALQAQPVAPLGEQTLYSNAGFVVAAAMAESVMDAPWETLMTRHVFAPLRMRSAGFGPPARLGAIDQPSGHRRGADNRLHPPALLKHSDLPTAMAPAGGVHASLGDLVTYLEATRDHRAPFLSASSWKTLQTAPFGGDYALGWGVTENGGLSHDGGNGQWLARLAIDRPSGLVAAVAFNAVTPQVAIAMDQAHAMLRA